jgi:dihydroxyacetone kinase-like protein
MASAAAQTGTPAAQAPRYWICLQAACMELLRADAELCALDRAIGDGDHGANMARGARAILAAQDELRALPAPAAVERAGNLIVNNVGGASGPLYGSLLLAMSRAWPQEATCAGIASALTEGVAAVGRRGRSTAGQKTMLDVLIPASDALRSAAGSTSTPAAIAAMLTAADGGFEASRGLRAAKGRAAYVGERSVGHDDPGAASARLCLHAVAEIFLSGHAAEAR